MTLNLKPAMLATAMLMALSAPLAAQTVNFNPRTGDVWVDQQLGTYNRYGTTDRSAYLDELVRRFGGERSWYERALVNGASPGDLYYACSLASETNRSCASVLEDRMDTGSKGQGWGVMAKSYGIKPGSPEFHQMKARMKNQPLRFDRSRPSVASPVSAGDGHHHVEGMHHEDEMNHEKKGKQKPTKSGNGKNKNKPHKAGKGNSGH